jgi:hypothetical protein
VTGFFSVFLGGVFLAYCYFLLDYLIYFFSLVIFSFFYSFLVGLVVLATFFTVLGLVSFFDCFYFYSLAFLAS